MRPSNESKSGGVALYLLGHARDVISITVSILGHIAWTVMDRVTTRGLVNLYPAVKVVPSMTDLLCLLAIGVNPQLI